MYGNFQYGVSHSACIVGKGECVIHRNIDNVLALPSRDCAVMLCCALIRIAMRLLNWPWCVVVGKRVECDVFVRVLCSG